MSIEKIERNKAKIDWFIFVFFILWIALRIVNNLEFAGLDFVLHFGRLVLVLGGLFLMMYYFYFSKQYTDELEQENKMKAYKFSWIIMMLSAIILFILSNKAILTAGFALEILLWTGYLSYFLSFKFLDAGLDSRFNNRILKVIGIVSVFLGSVVVGMNFGYKMPDVDVQVFNEYKALYIVTSVILVGLSIIVLSKFVKMIKDQENKKKENK